MKWLRKLDKLRGIAVKDTAVTYVGSRQLQSPELYEITADQSQASWEQIQDILNRMR